MNINKKELQKALEIVKPGVSQKDMIEQSTNFAFMGNRVVTYNDEISISTTIPDMDLTGAVSANELYSFLSKVKTEDIDIETTDNEILLKAGKVKAGLSFQTEIKLPLEEIDEITEWKELPENFIDALSFCSFCYSKDLSKPILTCIHIFSSGAESCDNARYSKKVFTSPIDISNTLIPGNTVKELIKYKPMEISLGTGWAHFKSGETIFSCRIFQDEYPNTSNMLDIEEDSVDIIFPKDMLDMIDKASVFSKSSDLDDSCISIFLENKKIIIKSKNTCGWTQEESPIRYSGEKKEFMINPTALMDICKQTNKCTINSQKIVFKESDWVHLIGLIVSQ